MPVSTRAPSSSMGRDILGLPLVPGVYRIVSSFVPEGTAEVALEECQLVKVVGRSQDVGCQATAIVDSHEFSSAQVPQSYLRFVRPFKPGEVTEEDAAQHEPESGTSLGTTAQKSTLHLPPNQALDVVNRKPSFDYISFYEKHIVEPRTIVNLEHPIDRDPFPTLCDWTGVFIHSKHSNGWGSFADVYKGKLRDLPDGTELPPPVAIKVMRPLCFADGSKLRKAIVVSVVLYDSIHST